MVFSCPPLVERAELVKKEAAWIVSGDRQEASSSFSGRRAIGTQRHGAAMELYRHGKQQRSLYNFLMAQGV